MGEPHAVLLVPTQAGAALLHVGPSLRIHPTDLGQGIAATRCGHPPRVIFHGRVDDALPVWWDGALVPEGWDRARRVAWDRSGFPEGPELAATLDSAEVMCPGWEAVLRLARALEAAGLCRLVLLDLVDGRHVERAP